MTTPAELDQVRERVRARYARAAVIVTAGGVPSCGDTCAGADEPGTGAGLYSAGEQGEVPADAVTASLARANAARTGAANVEFLHGHIEAVPLPDRSVDVIISNCVINLSGDKAAVFAESFRVLPGCIAGALSFAEYQDSLTQAGFTAINVTPTHEVAPGWPAFTAGRAGAGHERGEMITVAVGARGCLRVRGRT